MNKEFVFFGNLSLILAIFEIPFLISIILFMTGILILGILIIIILIGITIFRFIAVGSLVKANRALNNIRLTQSLNKLISCSILFLVGNIIFIGAGLGLGASTNSDAPVVLRIAIFIFTVIIGIILIFISGLIEYQAWDRLAMFFEQDQIGFAPNIAKSGNNGATLLKIGGLLNIFIVLIIVGSILRIIGFFILLSLKKLESEPAITAPVSVPVTQHAPATRPPPAPAAVESGRKFCPSCGNPLSGAEKFCGACGTELT